MSDLHSLSIRVPDLSPHGAEILLDGAPLRGVTRVELSIAADELVVATITMLVAPLTVDASVFERVYTSKDE